MPAGPGTGGHVAVNSPANGAQPLAFGGEGADDSAPVKPRAAVATQSTPPGGGAGMSAMQRQRNFMMGGGPGQYQRGGRGNKNSGAGRLPAAAYLPPKGDPNAAGAQAGQTGQQAAQPAAGSQPPPQAGGAPATPPAATTAPPPPPDPAEADPGSNDGSGDDGTTDETGSDTPAPEDGAAGQD